MRLVILTGGWSVAVEEDCMAAGADGALPKHLSPAQVMQIVETGPVRHVPPPTMSAARAAYEHMMPTLIANGRKKSKTAADLEIAASTLDRRLKERAPRR